MAKPEEAVDVRLRRDEVFALLVIANAIFLSDDLTKVMGPHLHRDATRALRRMVECFGEKWVMRGNQIVALGVEATD